MLTLVNKAKAKLLALLKLTIINRLTVYTVFLCLCLLTLANCNPECNLRLIYCNSFQGCKQIHPSNTLTAETTCSFTEKVCHAIGKSTGPVITLRLLQRSINNCKSIFPILKHCKYIYATLFPEELKKIKSSELRQVSHEKLKEMDLLPISFASRHLKTCKLTGCFQKKQRL